MNITWKYDSLLSYHSIAKMLSAMPDNGVTA